MTRCQPIKTSNFVFILFAGITIAIFAQGALTEWPLMLALIMLARILHQLVAAIYLSVPIFLLGHWGARKILRRHRVASLAWHIWFAWTSGCALLIGSGELLLICGVYDIWLWQMLAVCCNVGLVLWLYRQRWQPLRALWERVIVEARFCQRLRAALDGWHVIIGVILTAAFLHTMLPPNTRDELVYHLGIPKLWEFQHHWWMNTDNFHLLFPANLEILWGYALAVGGLFAPRMLTLIFALLTLSVMQSYLTETGAPPWIRSLSLIFWMVTPVVMVMLAINYVEWPLVFLILLGWSASRQYLATRERPYAYLTALTWSIALGGKYSVIVIVGLLSLECGYQLARVRVADVWPLLGACICAGALFVAPWLIRNYYLTGDPVFPLAPQRFLAETTAASPLHARNPAFLTNYENIPDRWRWYPPLYHMTVDRKIDHRLHLGWLFLHGSVIVGGWQFRRRLPWFTVLIASLFFAFFTPSPRIYVPLMALIWLFLPHLLAAGAQCRIARAITVGGMGLFVMSSLPLGLYFWFMTFNRAGQDYLCGMLDVNGFLQKDGLLTPVVAWVQKESPLNSRVWLWGSDRIFYFDRWVRPDASYDRPTFLRLMQTAGVAGLAREIAAAEIDYIVLDTLNCALTAGRVQTEQTTWRIAPNMQQALLHWIANNLQLILKDERFELYQVKK